MERVVAKERKREMKKLLILLILVIATPLWIYNNNWVLDKEDTLNYTPNRGVPLLFCLAQIDKAFSIRVMLPFENCQLQEELREYYETKLPKELNKALKSSGNLHNPTLAPLIKHFPSAFKSTTLYKKLEESVKDRGYGIDKEITFEKFTIDRNEKLYLFSADIWLETIPFPIDK